MSKIRFKFKEKSPLKRQQLNHFSILELKYRVHVLAAAP